MLNENNGESEEEEAGAISDTGKDIKKGMDIYQAKMKSALGEEEASIPPTGDSTRSEE